MKVLVVAVDDSVDTIKLEHGDKKRRILLNGCNTYIEREHGSDYLYSYVGVAAKEGIEEIMGSIDHDN